MVGVRLIERDGVKMESLYNYPAVYEALLAPDEEDKREVMRWCADHLDGPLKRVMDPACGPGTWLLPFARKGCFVAGNDLSQGMVDRAKRVLDGYPHLLVQGDMRALCMGDEHYDVTLNLDASIGHLPDHDAVLQHLQSVRTHTRPGGLYIVGLMGLDGEGLDTQKESLFVCSMTAIPTGGYASVAYASRWRDKTNKREQIEVLVSTEGVEGCPETIHEYYELLTFPSEDLRALVVASGWELEAVYSMEAPRHPKIELAPSCGDVTLILKNPDEAVG